MTSTTARIYDLHPLLAGPIERWPDHFPRIRAMGFDTLYVNAFFKSGGSGSIYAVADPFELHDKVRGSSTRPAAELVRDLATAAAGHGLRFITDLILPHAAIDGRLIEEQPDWFRRNHDGSPVRPLVTGGDGLGATMDDIAELDFGRPGTRAALLDWSEHLARHYLDLGVDGFRCSAAYKVPPDVWRELIARLRARHPKAVMIAAALGCPFESVLGLAGCGFDLVFDSYCWWDFRERWYLDQVEPLETVAPRLAFPEDHNTMRLGERLGIVDPAVLERTARARYLGALGLASAVMMPMGYEYGCRRPLHPATSDPADWRAETDAPAIDITGFIREANAATRDAPSLAGRGLLRRVSPPNGRIAAFLRFDAGSPLKARDATLLAVNTDTAQEDALDTGLVITAAGGSFASFEDANPTPAADSFAPGLPLIVEAGEARLLRAERNRPARPVARGKAASLKALQTLAANRIAIEAVRPELDGGRFAVKRMVGDIFKVEADIFCDGHDKLAAVLRYRPADERQWRETPMVFLGNDRWAGSFPLTRNIRYVYTIQAWRDVFATWRIEVGKKNDAGLDIALELEEGRALVRRTAAQATGEPKATLDALLEALAARPGDHGFQLARLLADDTLEAMHAADLRADRTDYPHALEVFVDRTAAAFAAWYELFPRSMSDDPARHGTFDDVIDKLPYVKSMGFDVLYFPPIHPIGRTNRKGRNNSLKAQPGDPGSPYAIGSDEGGHDAIHPELGSFDDFARLIDAALDHGLEIAIDFAIQCSPDHPWIREHPEWFDWRPDGTLRYAENPPKKYEDISNVSFYGEGALPSLWLALRDVVLFWVDKGVKIFRVDNPHTKPFPFWEWMIREVQDRHPETVFLAEAFTRPKVMKRLAKVGFTQSYSYFTWRNDKAGLIEYLTELTREEAAEHMRPNFFVNTPDINPVYLHTSGRAGFQARAVLAATLSTVWGVYAGFELCEGTPVPGKEEYLDSEKYQIRAWDRERPGNIRADIALLNRVRRDNPALWQFTRLDFMEAGNDSILVYVKSTEDLDNVVLVAVNLDPHAPQACRFEIPLWRFGLADEASIGVEDLVSGAHFTWTGKTQHLRLDPAHRAYAIWRLVPPGLPA